MRRITVVLAVAAVSLFLGLGPAAHAQTSNTSLPLPAGQGGPDNGVNNTQQGGEAPGGQTNPAVNAGPAIPVALTCRSCSWLPYVDCAIRLLPSSSKPTKP